MHETQFTAVISSRLDRGEELFHAEVWACSEPTYCVLASGYTENFQDVLHTVLDWSRRQGKEIRWDYRLTKDSRMKRLISSGAAHMVGPPGAQAGTLAAPNLSGSAVATGEALLTNRESAELFDCEKVIRDGLETFVQVGEALAKIRDSRLYRYQFGSFEQYVRDRWGMSARHAHRLIDGATIAKNLLPLPAEVSGGEVTNWSPLADAPPAPRNESQVRPLKGLEPAEQKEVWNEASKQAGNEPVTARHVEQAREEFYPKPSPWPQPNEHGVYEDGQAECIEFKHKLGSVHLLVLQIAKGKWVAARNMQFRTGNREGTASPLSAKEVFSSREEVLNHVTDRLLEKLLPYASAQKPRFVEQARIATKMREWAWDVQNGLKENPGFRLQVETAPKPESQIVRIRLAANQLVKDAQAVRELVESGSEISTKQVLHLSVALTHLKNFRASIEQIERKTAPKKKTSPASRALLSARLRARWAKVRGNAKNAKRRPA